MTDEKINALVDARIKKLKIHIEVKYVDLSTRKIEVSLLDTHTYDVISYSDDYIEFDLENS